MRQLDHHFDWDRLVKWEPSLQNAMTKSEENASTKTVQLSKNCEALFAKPRQTTSSVNFEPFIGNQTIKRVEKET